VADAAGDRTALQFASGGRFGAAKKIGAGLLGLFLFIFALQLLKTAAKSLGGIVVGIGVDTPVSALGFGWLFAYIVLSGSPVAAIALTFFASDVIDSLETFTMIAGSRFGAAFVVLLLGFIYMLRGKARRGRSLEMGVLSLLTTYVVYGIAIPIGALLLTSGIFDGFRPALPTGIFDTIELVYDPIVGFIAGHVPALLVFALGVGVILLAFQLFDKALPDLAEESPIRGLEAHVYRPIVMFGLGCVVTLFTLSVSVSLGLLVPLSAKGIARRENVIPYIMGANITTFVDTLLATLLLDKPEAFTVVLVEMLSVAVVSLVILLLVYSRFERILLATSRRILRTRGTLATFVVIILVVPLLLLLL
jgi:Na+/phosphate symporter